MPSEAAICYIPFLSRTGKTKRSRCQATSNGTAQLPELTQHGCAFVGPKDPDQHACYEVTSGCKLIHQPTAPRLRQS